MKNRPSGLSPYCWLSRMLPECWTRKLDTAYTIPGLSGQDSVSTYSRPCAAFIPHLRRLRITQRTSLYATILPHEIVPGQTGRGRGRARKGFSAATRQGNEVKRALGPDRRGQWPLRPAGDDTHNARGIVAL